MSKFYFCFLFLGINNVFLAQSQSISINGQQASCFIQSVPIYKLKIDKQYKLYNADGQLILTSLEEPVFTRHIYFSQNTSRLDFFEFRCGNKYGLFNQHGNLVLPLEYDKIEPNRTICMFEVERNRKKGLVDTLGNSRISCQYEHISPLFTIEGLRLVVVIENKKWGLLNSWGEILIPCSYDFMMCIKPLGHQWFSVRKDGFEKIVDEKGTEILSDYEYKSGFDYPYQRMIVRHKATGKWGMVDSLGRAAIKPKYDHIESFSYMGGWAKVLVQHRGYGFIDTVGNEIIPPIYATATAFRAGSSIVSPMNAPNKFGLIDTTGKALTPFQYDEILVGDYYAQKPIARVFQTNKGYGFITSTGREIAPSIYEDAYLFNSYDYFTKVKYKGTWYYLDPFGKRSKIPKPKKPRWL